MLCVRGHARIQRQSRSVSLYRRGWCGRISVWRNLVPKCGRLFAYGHVDTTNLVKIHWQFIKYTSCIGIINSSITDLVHALIETMWEDTRKIRDHYQHSPICGWAHILISNFEDDKSESIVQCLAPNYALIVIVKTLQSKCKHLLRIQMAIKRHVCHHYVGHYHLKIMQLKCEWKMP